LLESFEAAPRRKRCESVCQRSAATVRKFNSERADVERSSNIPLFESG
jgi:hypothetical protein